MLLAQECPRKQGGVCRQLVEEAEAAEVDEAGVAGDAMVVESQDIQVGVENSGAGSQPGSCSDGIKKYRTKRDKRLAAMKRRVAKSRRNK